MAGSIITVTVTTSYQNQTASCVTCSASVQRAAAAIFSSELLDDVDATAATCSSSLSCTNSMNWSFLLSPYATSKAATSSHVCRRT